MPRRGRKGQAAALGILIVFGLVFAALSKMVDSIGMAALIIGIVSVLVLIVVYKIWKHLARLAHLRNKYQDEEIVQRIMRRTFWQGQTSDQLLESLGNPKDIDRKLLATRKREAWKYNPRGVNRYGLRITLDNDIVAGWDQK
jgi:uncharacterized membrane protein